MAEKKMGRHELSKVSFRVITERERERDTNYSKRFTASSNHGKERDVNYSKRFITSNNQEKRKRIRLE